MVGEGDGRFLKRFLKANPNAAVDYVDASAGMMKVARRRVGADQRVNFIHADAGDGVASHEYDVIFTHFFLDCLTENELSRVVERITRSARDDASWIVSEFRIAERGWRRGRSHAWVRFLYASFARVTGLKAAELPDHGAALRRHGFRLQKSHVANAGLLVSEVWRRGHDRKSASSSLPVKVST
jgi:ubiquinone/menaquinone biosynthesis C-methylase UbiE